MAACWASPPAKDKVTTRSAAMLAVPFHLKFCFRHDPSVDANGCSSPHAWECRMISLRRHLPGCVGIGCSCPPAQATARACGTWQVQERALHLVALRQESRRRGAVSFHQLNGTLPVDAAPIRLLRRKHLRSDARRQSHARFQILPTGLDKRTRPVPLRPTPGILEPQSPGQ